jgi:hypothetical protein
LDAREQEKYWLGLVGLPPSCLRKTTVKIGGSIGVGRPLAHGTCQIRVHDVAIVQSIYGAIAAYVGSGTSFPG